MCFDVLYLCQMKFEVVLVLRISESGLQSQRKLPISQLVIYYAPRPAEGQAGGIVFFLLIHDLPISGLGKSHSKSNSGYYGLPQLN